MTWRLVTPVLVPLVVVLWVLVKLISISAAPLAKVGPPGRVRLAVVVLVAAL